MKTNKILKSLVTSLFPAMAVGAPTICLDGAINAGEIVNYGSTTTPEKVRFHHYSMPCVTVVNELLSVHKGPAQ